MNTQATQLIEYIRKLGKKLNPEEENKIQGMIHWMRHYTVTVDQLKYLQVLYRKLSSGNCYQPRQYL